MTKQSGATEVPHPESSIEPELTKADDPVTADPAGADDPTAAEPAGANDPDAELTGADDPDAEDDPVLVADDDASSPTEDPEVVGAPAASILAVLAVAWLAAMLWSAQRTISSSSVDAMTITSTAYALPGVISASLIGGAAVGLTLTNLLAHWGVTRATPRFAGAVGGGLVTGLLAALAVTLSYGDGPTIMVLAGTAAAAATLGGIAGGLRNAPPVGAVVTAALAAYVVAPVLNLFEGPLMDLYGAGETEASRLAAANWYSRTGWIISGLVAGLVAFGYLRWARRRVLTRDPGYAPLRWTGYLVAGAGPGLLLVIAEILTRTAGARVLELAGALSEADRAVQSMLGTSRVDYALGVLFVGGFVALIAFGRTLRPAAPDPVAEAGEVDPAQPEKQPAVGAGRPHGD
ncbi:hypothetical protein GCM10027280_58090 [Micromonospora polyrhachis]|uniref:MFS family permease n=1 Tax=Micromonospora polyrhachis TaxID=1282883 RepID=A0A7W7SNB6_9ACTN|nr:hypothetical protein [Micromonospora polyrhachis]MBB4957953.1 MFS family permease [Micromonospora polyrhachis]